MKSTQVFKPNPARTLLVLLVAILIIGAVSPAQPRITRAEIRAGASSGVEHGWTAPINVSKSPIDMPKATWPSLQVSADGQVVYLAWSDRREAWQNIYYALSIDGGRQWGAAQVAAETEADSLRPSLALLGAAPVIVWSDESFTGLTHTTYQWSLDTQVVQMPNEHTWLASANDLVAGAGGELHLTTQGGVGNDPDILYTRRDVGATEWPTTTVVFQHTASGSHNPAIAVSADGQVVHLVWQENELSASAIYYLQGHRSGGEIAWQSPISLTLGITRAVRPAISLGMDSETNPTVHVVWGDKSGGLQEQYVGYVRSDDGGASWGTPIHVSPEPVSANNSFPTDVAPALAVTPSGAVCVAWHGFFPDVIIEAEEIYVSCSTDGGDNWVTPVNVSHSPTIISIRPELAVGGDGILHLAWQELAGTDPERDYQIYYVHNMPYLSLLPIVER